MSRVTAAFVCALCDPDNPRPASIMCSNNCGRYVCAAHAMPRKGPGSAMICQACAEALGLIDKPKPKPAPEVRPLIEIAPEPTMAAPEPTVTAPEPTPTPIAPKPAATASAFEVEPFPTPPPSPEAFEVEPFVTSPAAEVTHEVKPSDEQVTIVTPPVTPLPPKESIVIDNVEPFQPHSSSPLSDTGPASKSAASETVISQRGNTLQVPKVSPSLGKPPQPIAPKPRKAQRTNGGKSGSNIDWQLIAMIAGTVVLGVVGFVMILAALAGAG